MMLHSLLHMTAQRFYWLRIYLAVALTSAATLLLELSITRIYSVFLYYHFAFLAISIALFGLGIGGLFSYVVEQRGWNIFSSLGSFAALNSLLIVGALVFIFSQKGGTGFKPLLEVYLSTALPFFFAGAILSLALAKTVERVDKVYGFDLLGAATGCLLLVYLLNHLGGPNTVIGSGLLFGISSVFWFSLAGKRGWVLAGACLSAALSILILYNDHRPVIDFRYAKGSALQNELFVKWNSFSRIALVKRDDQSHEIIIDADAGTRIPFHDYNRLTEKDRQDLLYSGAGIAYLLRPGAKTLIIGPGGGTDVARAIAAGSKDITGVEINPIIADVIMKKTYPALSNYLYYRPEFHLVIEDGRSYVRRTPEKFGILQATLVDTWASTAAGAFALSENNLYTTEAFYDYLGHLSDDGIMVFTRWGFEPPRESLRLVSLAREALGQLEVKDFPQHIIVLREGMLDTILVSRKPFTNADITLTKNSLDAKKLAPLYLPGEIIPNAFSSLILTNDVRQFERNYPYDISAVSDDRPFFFYTVQARDLWNYLNLRTGVNGPAEIDRKINLAVPVLFSVTGISIIAVIVILALPPLVLRRRLPADRSSRKFLWYFIFIGVSYILIEVALIQKFILFLGHPTYALTIIVFSLLITSGIGSYCSRRLLPGSDRRLLLLLISVSAIVTLMAFSLVSLLRTTIGWPFWSKALLSILIVAPAGFAMGMPFPTGLRRLEIRSPLFVKWAWSLNAAASVLGSVGAILLAIYLGLRATLLIGGLTYLGACVVVLITRRSLRSENGLGTQRREPSPDY
jgi:spermidine synthase